MPKKSKLLTREGWFKVFPELRVEDHNKNYNFSTFYVTDIFSTYYSQNSCKKIQTLSIKLSTEVTTYILVRKKQKSFCEIVQNIKIITEELIVNLQMKLF